MLFMEVRYDHPIPLDTSLLETLKRWHDFDPVSQEEFDRSTKIQQEQGTRNFFIDNPTW
jgi:deoxyribonuclease-1